ncbi:MAG: (2Fe-2S)-binding protein [Planctomyces sp.]|nr:(2Fe-2S)-binding protein [Planctomyces sp.]
MEPDDLLCYCFHVRKRKVQNFLRVQRPRVASELSQCGGAGTGCGWCVPYLKRMFEDWRQGTAPAAGEPTAADYAQQRAAYIRAGKGRPPAGAEPLPDEST